MSERELPDETFPELAAFMAAERARHRRLVGLVLAGSVGMIASGVGALAFAIDRESPGVFSLGAILLGLGVLGVVRGLVSRFTTIDTRDRRPFDVEVPPLDDEDRP